MEDLACAITHEKKPPGPPPTEASRRFLHGYINSLLCVQQHPSGDVVKGKMVLNAPPILTRESAPLKDERGWVAPELGNTELNTDGSFVPATGLAGGGMVLRDSEGKIMFSACREIHACDNALTVELAACR